MKAIVLLNHGENTKQIEAEEKTRFVKDILQQIGVPIDFWDTDVLSKDQKTQLNLILLKYNIQVIDDSDGKLQMFVDNEPIATWNKPTYKLKKDPGQLDRKKQLYLEMTIDCNSPFDETSEKEIQ